MSTLTYIKHDIVQRRCQYGTLVNLIQQVASLPIARELELDSL